MKPEWLCLFYFERVCPDQEKRRKILCKLKVSSFGMWVQKWEGEVQKLIAASVSFFLDSVQLISILQMCWAREKLTLCPNHCARLFSSSPDVGWLDQQDNWTVWAIIISLGFQFSNEDVNVQAVLNILLSFSSLKYSERGEAIEILQGPTCFLTASPEKQINFTFSFFSPLPQREIQKKKRGKKPTQTGAYCNRNLEARKL